MSGDLRLGKGLFIGYSNTSALSKAEANGLFTLPSAHTVAN